MVEKMVWGTREHLHDSWWIDSPVGGTWEVVGGVPQEDKRFICNSCKAHFFKRDAPLVFKFDQYDSFHCEPCAKKVGIIW